MLGLGIDADAARFRLALRPCLDCEPDVGAMDQSENFFEAGNREDAVEAPVVRTQLRDRLLRAQRLQFRQGEVLGEPAFGAYAVDRLCGPAAGKLGMIGHVRRAGDLVVMTCDEYAVLRHHQIRFDEIRAHFYGERVGGERVLGRIAAGAPVGDNDRLTGFNGAHATEECARLREKAMTDRDRHTKSVANGKPLTPGLAFPADAVITADDRRAEERALHRTSRHPQRL